MVARRIIGAILVVLGGIWFFQGLGVIGGSFMTNSSRWLVIGAVVAFLGALLIGWPRRTPN